MCMGPEAILNFPRCWYDSDALPNGWLSNTEELQSVLSKFRNDHNAAPRYCVQSGCIGSSFDSLLQALGCSMDSLYRLFACLLPCKHAST